jgi:hypothetical protein
MQGQDSFEDDLITIKPRDFKCPCGKTYLSYAALFTHIKQKHEGKVPPKLLRPQEKSPSLLLNTKKEDVPPSNPNSTKNSQKKSRLTSLQVTTIRFSLLKLKRRDR